MASIVFNRFYANLANKVIDWEADDIRVALTTSVFTPDVDQTNWSQVTSEVSGTAYTANGEQLTPCTVTQDDTNDLASLDAPDITWQTSTITAYYAIIYDSTAANDLIACIDFGADKSSSDGDFTIQWDASGIISIMQS